MLKSTSSVWKRSLVAAVFGAVATLPLLASDYSVKSIDKAPPAKLGDSVKAELSEQGLVILKKDKPLYELWLRKSLPLKTPISSPSAALKSIGQTTLLGAMTVISDERDYRDDELYEGIYTVRFGLRPEDGNHLGTSEHLYFAVLVDAKNDQELGKIAKSKQLVKASSKTSANDHPMILSLYPVGSATKETLAVHEPAPEHQAVRLSIPAKNSDGSDAGNVAFDLVVEGLADF